METIKERVVQCGIDLGFDLVGIATAESLPETEAELNHRIETGIYSPLVSGSPKERTTPTLLLPGAQSVIMVAMAYSVDPNGMNPHGLGTSSPEPTVHHKGEPKNQPNPGTKKMHRGLLSRYAWGQDYHHVMVPRLNQLAAFVESIVPGARCRVMVDSGPLVEKAMAYRAGLGFYGWNSCLITERFGSWVFLGSLLTTASLPPDEFKPRTCRECGRCIEACPTGAITAPYVVNPYLCLSQVTQTRGIMPERFYKPLGNRLFGCDTCQEVCPHNGSPEWGNHQEFIPHPLLGTAPPLEMVLDLTNRSFGASFGQIAAGWRGKKILQRNALINLGNTGDPQVIPHIVKLLEDPTDPIQVAASWALSNIRENHREENE